MTEKTRGEKTVRTEFNVNSDSDIDAIKKKTAKLIDDVDGIGKIRNPDLLAEQNRLIELSIQHYEIAAMFAVKAETVG